jgi:hypothetical protein
VRAVFLVARSGGSFGGPIGRFWHSRSLTRASSEYARWPRSLRVILWGVALPYVTWSCPAMNPTLEGWLVVAPRLADLDTA